MIMAYGCPKASRHKDRIKKKAENFE